MATRSKNILLVDDNPLFLKLLKQAFAKSGISCDTALSVTEALEHLQHHTPDIILSDYEMPGRNGMDFRRELMNEERLKDIPFIFLTGVSDERTRYKGLGLQAIDYVIKDTPIEVIIAKVSNLLRTVDKQRQLSELEIRNTVAALNIKTVTGHVPKINGLQFDLWHQDYQDIPGGDVIDFIEPDDHHVYIVLSDVMGKKWKAWFYTFGYLSYIRAAIRMGTQVGAHTAADMLRTMNTLIYDDERLSGILASLSLIRVDKRTGEMSYAGAGDLPLLHYQANSGQMQQIDSSGLLLGLMADGGYTDRPITLRPGDQLFIFSDGLTDMAVGDEKKSDYHSFARQLQQHLQDGHTFAQLKESLKQRSANLVDDSSIIHILKTPHT